MIPPARTAATTAADVQLVAVPRPTTRAGCEVSTGRAPAGSATERAPGSAVRVAEAAAGGTPAPTTSVQKQPHRDAGSRRMKQE